MKYVEVIFQLNPWNEAASDILAALCGDMGFETFVTEEPLIKGYIQKSCFEEQQLRDTLDYFPMPEVTITYSAADAEDKDWNEEWEKNGFEPIIIGSELTVQGIGHNCNPNTRYEIQLDHDSGATAHHGPERKASTGCRMRHRCIGYYDRTQGSRKSNGI